MKKTFFTFSISLISTLVFSQEWKEYDWHEWKDYKLDENVTIQVPSTVNVDDMVGVAGQKIYSSRATKGTCLFFVSPRSNNFKAANKMALNKIYSDLIGGYINGSHGQLIDTNTIFKGKLEGKSIRAYVNANGTNVICETHFFLLGDRIYQFQFVQQENIYDSLDVEQVRFFDSAQFVKNPNAQTQFSNTKYDAETSPGFAYSLGYFFGKLLIFAGAIMFIVIIIVKYRRRH